MKTAVVASGGAMKCVWGGGAFTALAELGIKPDFCVAVSGNAGSALYFATQQMSEMKRIWTQHLSGDSFVSPSSYPHVFKLSYLIDDLIFGREHINTEVLLAKPQFLHIPATNLETGSVRWFTGFNTEDELREALRAAMAVIVGYSDPVIIDGIPYGDSPISWSLETALDYAIAQGATRVILVDNHSPASWLEKLTYHLTQRHQSEAFKHLLSDTVEHRENLRRDGVEIIHITPSINLRPFARNSKTLAHAFRAGIKDTREVMTRKLGL